ncbi:MAG: FHA domain-containing protein [Planctomycetia bacterium]|nr:FHA domain-containing protein [Planctomycetia bacterium]
MDVKLVVVGGKHAGQEIKITKDEFEIGKSPKCQLRPGGTDVERHHCKIVRREGYAGVRDLNTPSGTFVNEERIEGERELKNGDHLRIGVLTFEVQLTVGVSGKKMSKVQTISEAASRASQKKSAKKENPDDDLDVFAIFGEDEPTEEDLPSFITRAKSTESTEVKSAEAEQDALAQEKRKQESTRNAAADTIKAMLNQARNRR